MTTIDGTTQLLGIIGDPVAHSLSPVMHNAALQSLGQNYVYLPFPVLSQHLPSALAGLAAIGVQGLNVTIPHKQAVIPHLIAIDSAAKAIGAVNTLYRRDPSGGWIGSNTDWQGFLAPLLTLPIPWDQQTATILGAGGAARAVIQACWHLGVGQVQVVGRSPEGLLALQQQWPALLIRTWGELEACLPHTHLLVNTTPIGMLGKSPNDSPLSLPQLGMLPGGSIVYDLIYTPRPTLLLDQAMRVGLMAIDGLEMLVQQGSIALSSWLGSTVPVEVMRQVVLERLLTP
ncbi:MAG: shikimate dehydrogenase [Cyanobacteriota bacterium]|nr:shikimate dehydrogenase [Cyanobacteriota bacterium]